MNALKQLAFPMLALTVALAGCADSPTSTLVSSANDSAGTGHAAHAHPTEGPHHGALIELGAEEYHGELVHDEQAGTVTVWILDSAAKATVPIEATEITINLKHDGQGRQFRLAAKADAKDPSGRSSCFSSESAELGAGLHLDGAEAMLALSIDGRSFRGVIPHGHHHADHAHDHHAHDHNHARDHAGGAHDRH